MVVCICLFSPPNLNNATDFSGTAHRNGNDAFVLCHLLHLYYCILPFNYGNSILGRARLSLSAVTIRHNGRLDDSSTDLAFTPEQRERRSAFLVRTSLVVPLKTWSEAEERHVSGAVLELGPSSRRRTVLRNAIVECWPNGWFPTTRRANAHSQRPKRPW